MSAIGSASSTSSHAQAQIAQEASLSANHSKAHGAKDEGKAVASLRQEASEIETGSSEPGKGEGIDVHG